MTSLIPFPTKVPGLIAAWATPISLYGGSGAISKIFASRVIPGNSFLPNSIIEINADFDFPSPAYAGRTVSCTLGGLTLFQSYPAATVNALSIKWLGYVAPDLQSLTVFTLNANSVLSPTAGQGATFSAQSTSHTTITIDMTQAQTFAINGQPQNNDIMTLNGFSVTNSAMAGVNVAPALATAIWGDSLTSGTGSLGPYILSFTGNTTNGSNSVTSLSNTAGLQAGQVFNGSGIPSGTIITAISGTTATLSQNATATASAVALNVMSGSYPQQMMYNSGGRPVASLGVSGQISAQIAARVLADVIRGKYWNCVFNMGRNDVGNASLTSVVTGNLATAIANLAAGVKYVVCTILPAANETVGSTNWNAIVALNNQINTTYSGKVADVFAALTASGTVLIPLKYRNCTNTTGSITSGSATLTVASAAGLSVGMYCISPGSTAINNGSTSTAPTITAISGTTITLSANASATLSSAMVSFIGSTEVHMNDLGYAIHSSTILSALTAQGI